MKTKTRKNLKKYSKKRNMSKKRYSKKRYSKKRNNLKGGKISRAQFLREIYSEDKDAKKLKERSLKNEKKVAKERLKQLERRRRFLDDINKEKSKKKREEFLDDIDDDEFEDAKGCTQFDEESDCLQPCIWENNRRICMDP